MTAQGRWGDFDEVKVMIYTLESKLNFGKHGPNSKNPLTVDEVIKSDPDWLAWACDNIDWFELDQEAILALDLELFLEDETAVGGFL
jgi:hypothetical protein